MKLDFRSSPLAGLLLLASLGAAGAAMAEPAPPFAALLAQAQASAPRLAEARANIARAEGLARQAGVLPNPTLELEVENFSGSGPFRGTSLSETTARVGQTLELGGKRSARVAAGRAEVEAARAQARRAAAEYAFDLATAYAEAEASERRLQLARESLTLAEEDARIASALVDAGREAELRRLQAQAAVQSAQAAVQAAQATRETALGALTALAGAPAPITSIPASLLESSAPIYPGATPAAAATTSYLAAQAEREAAARRLRVERRRAVPDVTVSIGVRRFEEDDASALVAGVSVPLPLFDQNRGNIAAARAEAAAAEARLDAARLEAESAVRTSAARTAAAESRLSAARQGESTALEAYRLARIGYEAGRLPLTELVAARRALAEAREQTIAAAVERISAQAAVARLSGVATPGEQ
ncbi:MAG: transporter [Phenylobacterium sp. RIFCSPHIGHO2_01_FULL_69_31]|uniref:TolC family protein n=3 Tax=unclassified Phenylobacterium TaxID=2640670 RepID=UPI0008BBD7D2|nr:TolC family protein [Phenylobacterium sp. RIFCSPHIGHO2_01_FULL_69_31]OHB26686.1 MAG: transporter [Phenylobacterium sp. RIFCSPHIGHO2_01_FULL_69_31]